MDCTGVHLWLEDAFVRVDSGYGKEPSSYPSMWLGLPELNDPTTTDPYRPKYIRLSSVVFLIQSFLIIKKENTYEMPSISVSTAFLTLAVLLLLAHPAAAFGAGNIGSISKIEGVNCKLEDCATFSHAKKVPKGAMAISKILYLRC